jgi:hypothetical protein
LYESTRMSDLPVSKGYRPARKMLSKASEIKDRVAIKKLLFDDDIWEVEAMVESYTVKIYMPLDFECDCPYSQHHFTPCEHVFAVILRILEFHGADINDSIIRHYVVEGLYRLAYHKARVYRQLV